MTVGILKLMLYMSDSNSLKHKRMILHSLKARLRNNFNVALAQVSDEDKWQKSGMVVVGVEKDKSNVSRILSKVVDFIRQRTDINIIDYEIELI